jgi:hypothetical protein
MIGYLEEGRERYIVCRTFTCRGHVLSHEPLVGSHEDSAPSLVDSLACICTDRLRVCYMYMYPSTWCAVVIYMYTNTQTTTSDQTQRTERNESNHSKTPAGFDNHNLWSRTRACRACVFTTPRGHPYHPKTWQVCA